MGNIEPPTLNIEHRISEGASGVYFVSSYHAIWMFSKIFSLDPSGLSLNSSSSMTILCSFGKLNFNGSWSGNLSSNAQVISS